MVRTENDFGLNKRGYEFSVKDWHNCKHAYVNLNGFKESKIDCSIVFKRQKTVLNKAKFSQFQTINTATIFSVFKHKVHVRIIVQYGHLQPQYAH